MAQSVARLASGSGSPTRSSPSGAGTSPRRTAACTTSTKGPARRSCSCTGTRVGRSSSVISSRISGTGSAAWRPTTWDSACRRAATGPRTITPPPCRELRCVDGAPRPAGHHALPGRLGWPHRPGLRTPASGVGFPRRHRQHVGVAGERRLPFRLVQLPDGLRARTRHDRAIQPVREQGHAGRVRGPEPSHPEVLEHYRRAQPPRQNARRAPRFRATSWERPTG